MLKKEHYGIGLVLSGGGFRGAAHIGAIKALEDVGIYPEVVSGVSAGALVGAGYAAGLSTNRMLELFMKPRIFSLAHYTYNKPGLLDTDKLITYLEEYIPQSSYDELKIPLFISATNMLTGKLVTFHTGELNKLILASCAFPFVFSPVWMENSYYSDGGIINNFPVEPLIGKCQKIIGVYVNPVREIQPGELKSSLKVLERAFSISTGTIPYLKFKHCDLVVEPKELAGYNLFDRKNVMKMYEIGYSECRKMIEMIQDPDEYKISRIVKNSDHIENLPQ